ncbi:hypothetical protein CHLRE_04g216150v5 [Chlamydomonas reinhardtii]|uniref:Uncharacterized protein n=1 Tax=Chlamydomonas reinhardtii TaxID=3055 RepID=A0A2K3DTQ4_CHLRE|nr:uncharacterized protein CHLRE_04g216150v5 [Chlamydomonas reinhardtii]PNW83903.1 hypothetical protein CHLRE_04g216150v5 [Chlamydomonas reinhardtii]
MSWGGQTGSSKKNDGFSSLTKETQQLLQGVAKDRGLSHRAMQDMASSVQRGDAAWVNHLSSGTAAFQAPKSKTAPLVKAPKVGAAGGSGPALAPPLPGRFSGKKMHGEILRDTPYERDLFVGGAPVTDREAEKDRLSKLMELGAKGAAEMDARMAAMRKEAKERAAKAARVDVKEAKIDQIVDEIQERLTFLESMKGLGRGAEYERQIRTEVAVRLKELEKLGVPIK